MAAGDEDGIRIDEIVELDEAAAPAINRERARQQVEFHAREVRELAALIAADPPAPGSREPDPRRVEQQRHRVLECLCREIALAFDWLVAKDRPSRDLDLALATLREGYETAPEVALLRAIAETTYPLLTQLAASRANGVGLLAETQLGLKHAARGRPLADTLSLAEAEALLEGWLAAAANAPAPLVPLMPVRQALEWLAHLAMSRRVAGHGRPLEDDLEATIYLARGTLDEAGFAYAGPEEPV
jgi:hypothetical protein